MIAILSLAIFFLSIPLQYVSAQIGVEIRGNAGIKPDGETEKEERKDDDMYQRAGLPTDPEIQTFLQRAQDYSESEQYDTAVRLLQKVLEEGDQAMVKTGRRVYQPASETAQGMLIELPEEGLETYRILADANAAALLDAPGARRNSGALHQIVRQYFLSSLGDEAAYRLACLYINRHQFSQARRLLNDILEYHVDLPAPREEILLRLTVASAQLGDYEGAKKVWAELSAGFGSLPSETLKQIEAEIERAKKSAVATSTGGDWPMAYGSSSRNGVTFSPELTSEKKENVALVSVWEQDMESDRREDVAETAGQTELLTQMWIENNYQPVDQMAIVADRIWASSPDGIRCIAKKTGRKIWSTGGKAPFQNPNQKNRRIIIHHRVRRYNFQESAYFKDRTGDRISVFGGLVFRTEGNWKTAPTRRRVRQGNRITYITERTGSYLSAYNAETGKLKWAVGGGKTEDKNILSGCRFMNAPVPCGTNALVAIEKNDGLYLAALHPKTGRISWQQFLCAYASSPVPPKKPVGVAVDSGEVYVATGKGVVFALDGVDGHIHWASTYQSNPLQWAPARLSQLRGQKKEPDGWSENAIFPTGKNLLTLPGDAPTILCLDRSSGELRYKKARNNAEYPLGLVQNNLIVAGDTFIRAHEVRTGSVVWEQQIEPPTGRGILTRNFAFLPQDGSIRVLSVKSGQKISKIHVGLSRDLPLGNLYSDGNRIYCAGLSRAFALSTGARLLAELNQNVKKQHSAAAYLARGRFYSKTARYAQAVRDLRNARNLALEDPRQVRFNQLVDALAKIQEEKNQLRSKLAWFADSFNRAALGPDYTKLKGEAEIKDSALRMSDGQQLLVKLNKLIPGNFSVEIDGWQLDRPCDLSFKLDITSPQKTVKALYAQFGANWNVRNILQFDGNQVCVTNDYLIEKGKRHQLKLVRFGQQLTMYVDGRRILQHEGNLPPAAESKTTLYLYGFGGEHFFDNLTIKRLDASGNPLIKGNEAAPTEREKQLKEELVKLQKQEGQTEQAIAQLREQGYANFDAIRVPLFESLLKLAGESLEHAPSILKEARTLAQSLEEMNALQMAGARVAMARGDLETAATSYSQIIESAGKTLIRIDQNNPGHRVTASLWAQMKLGKLEQSGKESLQNVIRQAAREHLNRVQAREDVSFETFYRIMHAYPGTPSGIRAGLLAAETAENAGKICEAELILLQMQNFADKKALAKSQRVLAKFYERQGWNRQAYRTWQTLQENTADLSLDTGQETRNVGEYCKLAMERLREKAGARGGTRFKTMPDPPYRLLWKAPIQGYIVRQRIQSDILSDFLDSHIILMDYQKRKLVCKEVKTGETRWQRDFQNTNRFARRGHMIIETHPHTRAISLINGQVIWEKDVGGTGINRSRARVSVGRSNVVVADNAGGLGGYALHGIDTVTGEVRWRRQLARQSRPNILILSGYVVDLSYDPHTRNHTNARVYDASSGKLFNSKFPRPRGRQFWSTNGVICQEGNEYVLREFPDGNKTWKLPIKNANRSYVRGITNSSAGLFMKPGGYALIDPVEKEIRWRIETDGSKNLYATSAVYDPRRDEILVIKRIGKGKNWSYSISGTDPQTGKPRDQITLEKHMRLYNRGSLPVNDRFMAVMESVRKKQKNQTRIVNRRYRIVRRKDGQVLPGVRLPHLKDLSDREKRYHFQLHVVGNSLVFTGSGKVLVYEHDSKKELK